ncbi:peptide/nickel transport system substrate-binding protein [Tamaricihabitans halophyticus]|uniref:Peptide/nickel transport system substrate-binding protein n=1 Tax=Tamaricihabitans halophyticus TaxID=1262583 RepID=A0A4R2QEQ9_9PSEU|nr:ABC transporter substrate-binding protein [Tamaricihabitans halophyticus]TCP45455.1 peptide/nickel transport system substrate-binding protein [Tamaricihabitans halophyticus]
MRSRAILPAIAITAAVIAAGCTAPADPDDDQTNDPRSMVLADSYEPDSLNPLLGYAAEGAAKFYDGLLAFDGQRDLRPALADEQPEVSADGKSWTVSLRDDVTFHDGSELDADDVVATYNALIDPAYASTLSSEFRMLDKVTKVDANTVRFSLKFSYAAWPAKMVLGIVPSEALRNKAPLEDSALNSEPVGTGPYKLVDWRKGDQMVWEANPDYWGGVPKISEITVVFAPDDNTRAQRMQSGEFDGTVLPPTLAKSFEDSDTYRTVYHKSADFRSITLPSDHPVTGDSAVREALNLAVDRQAMVDGLLGGHGSPASTPFSPALPEFVEPEATFDHDVAEAERILDEAGWRAGDDGVRAKGGQRAAFTVMYFADDSLRKELAQAFASDAKDIGIEVELAGLDRTAVQPRLAKDAIVLGGGNPIDPDPQAYDALHSSRAGDGYANPGHYRNDEVDTALDRARGTTDPAQRAAYYRQVQKAYVADPGLVYLVFLEHAYLMRERWSGYQPVVEPHTHGTTWGPWWNVEKWAPRT